MPSTAFIGIWEDIQASVNSLNAGLLTLSDTNTASNATLATKVQALTEAVDLLPQQIGVLIREVAGIPDLILLKDADDFCIQHAFTFMRTLNEIESLMTDSSFTAKKGKGRGSKASNNDTLASYKNSDHALYRNCVEILDEQRNLDRLSAEQYNQFTAYFNALFEDVEPDFSDRAERLVEIHEFRDRILKFFAKRCSEQLEAPNTEPTEPTVNTQISLVQGDTTSS
ncbi:hypothetical protein [Nodosilinea sp. FACHB-13]|uniref:hypothetical protein n=1 Tax=Cyanophyceae TaxID=3028117 RepID=UPI0016869244|nr:hypothetical protein [Nodosilinea sp. FACHB-13]MBD2108952.1 hypothetical protein [Nodosilinea sp. FACHB-13]